MDKRSLDQLIEAQYPSLPPALQRAARHIIDHPKDVALHSMRALAAHADLPASAMNRLARQLGFDGYDALRAVYRDWVAQGEGSFADRATGLQRRGAAGKGEALLRDVLEADMQNLRQMQDPAVLQALEAARDVLADARRIHVVGLRSLFPAAFYFNYACGMFRHGTTLLSGIGGIFADELRGAGRQDALVAFSYDPYARDTVSAVTHARELGVRIVGVTDSAVSPVAAQAKVSIVVPNTTPSLFASVVPAMAVAQALAALLLAGAGKAGLREVARSEAQLRQFAVYQDDGRAG
ncbi:transcriptional regulator [Bordetella ansorpii]|uniref:Transcriptional regulator n=1 Tax=Bordetella ansorpii TaxID=288768 RepID=A0A157NG38_9BORD|nr:MurR/RpiR family transcriptional regulator [Bordetella ansorpii]SAI20178.1 transcriptional regulator [Bordetella ansorpii]